MNKLIKYIWQLIISISNATLEVPSLCPWSSDNKTKLLGNTVADGNNGILKNTTITIALKHLSNFFRSLDMLLINCKVEWKLKWINYCILSAAGADNYDTDSNDIIFAIEDTKLYVPIVT